MTYRVAPIDVSEITKAVVAQLEADVDLNSTSVKITRSEDENIDPNACPWIGVYRLSVQYPQRQLTSVAGFRAQSVRMMVMVSQSHLGSGQECEDSLEALIRSTIAALLSDTTLRGTVQFTDDFEVDYVRYARNGQYYMQTATIQFAAITNTQIIGG